MTEEEVHSLGHRLRWSATVDVVVAADGVACLRAELVD